MAIIHFTATFTNSFCSHHCSFESERKDKELIAEARALLTMKMLYWQRKAEELIRFEVYDNERKQIFLWEK